MAFYHSWMSLRWCVTKPLSPDFINVVPDTRTFWYRTQHCHPIASSKNFFCELLRISCDPTFFYRIHHYCGPVTYTASCFAEKNQDFLPKHISSGMYQSKLPIMQYLFPEGNPKKSSKKPTSISSNLRTSLQALLQNLSQRRNHYVFCIRPNEFKEPRAFELPLVQHQVRYLGYGYYFLHWIHWISLNRLLSGYYHLQIYGVLVTTFI